MAAGTGWILSGAVVAVLGGVGAYSMMSADCGSCVISSMFNHEAKVVAASDTTTPTTSKTDGCCPLGGAESQTVMAAHQGMAADHCEGGTGECPYSEGAETTLASDAMADHCEGGSGACPMSGATTVAASDTPLVVEAKGQPDIIQAAEVSLCTEKSDDCGDCDSCGDCDQACEDGATQTVDSGTESAGGAG